MYKLNKITSLQAALIIGAFGFAVFFNGLNNPFQGDDYGQIVENKTVQSITNIRYFFTGGTFIYQGDTVAPLEGPYYRPLMTTTFSLIYTIFGANPIYFHLLQLFLSIGSAFLLYLFFKYLFNRSLSLLLALVFLVHPINSQITFAIPSMQDSLFLFFGILAMWLLFRFKSKRSLWFVSLCLFASLLSKETAVIFVLMSFVYVFLRERERLLYFISLLVPVGLVWFLLRLNAVGLLSNPHGGPIGELSFGERLLTLPSIVLFYIVKLIFPLDLASGYYWVHDQFSIRNVFIPLVIDLLVIAVLTLFAYRLKKRSSKAMFNTYLFFVAWTAISMLMISQVIPLDMTASESWFCMPLVGVLGMIGVVASEFSTKLGRLKSAMPILVMLIIVVLGIRTAIRGFDWRSEYTISITDISNSKENHRAYTYATGYLIKQGSYSSAHIYAKQAVYYNPSFNNYVNMGITSAVLGEYLEAEQAFDKSLKYAKLVGQRQFVYEQLSQLMVISSDYNKSKTFFKDLLEKFPNNPTFWTYLAILEDKNDHNDLAKSAIANATLYGNVPQLLYFSITNDRPLTINIFNTKVEIP